MNLGFGFGYPTIALAQLMKNQSNTDVNVIEFNKTITEVSLNEYEGSSFASLGWLSGIVCTPVGGVLSGWLGRKRLLTITTPIGAIGWLLVGFAQNKFMLFFGYFINQSTVCLSVSLLCYFLLLSFV